MSKEPVHVFLGDLHAGSKLAPLVAFTDVDGVQYGPSKLQAFLVTLWRDALDDVKQAARGCEVVLHLGGDLVDGVGHHGTTQTVLDWNGQRDLAVELLIVDIFKIKGWAPIRAQREMVKLEALGKWQRRSVKLPNKRRADAWRPVEVIAK